MCYRRLIKRLPPGVCACVEIYLYMCVCVCYFIIVGHTMLVFKRFYDLLSIIAELVLFALFAVPYVNQDAVLVSAQDGGFELPVQLVGFPVIIMAVRMSNFVRKLAYSLSPSTYRRSARKTRGADSSTEPPLNFSEADQELQRQLGPEFCVYQDVCLNHAKNAGRKTTTDWTEIINNYSQLPYDQQQYYLLSVFLGDIIGSTKLCQHFSETGRICH